MVAIDSAPEPQRDAAPGPGAVTLLANDLRLNYRVAVDRPDGRRLPFGFGTKYDTFEAIKGISLIAREGEFIGLIGRNGSGKSTLLRLLAGVETADAGTVLARSRPQLLGVRAALVPNLSGLENVRLGLLAMGLTPEEAKARRDRVIELADMGDSIRRPMKTYSVGMKARLRFAISVAGDPDILMIDEALATGDAAFIQRSKEAMYSMMQRAGTGFLVSHSSRTIGAMCTRAIWLDSGEVVEDGPVDEVLPRYRLYARALAKGKVKLAAKVLRESRQTPDERFARVMDLEAFKQPQDTDDVD